jgi:glycosyltransferase involved in cell wall biosynthesis
MHFAPYPREQAVAAWIAARHAATTLGACTAGASPRQRVLMTVDTTSDVWQYALELARALMAAGHEVALATTGGMPDREQRREADAIPGLGLHASAYKPSPFEDCAERRAAGRWLFDLAAGIRPSVLHLNGFDHADLPWKMPVLLAVHTCVQSWWRAVHGTPVPESWRWYRQRVAAALRMADVVVAPTRDTLLGLHRHHGSLRVARVIANGRDPANTPAPAKGEYVFSRGDPGDRSQNFAALEAAAASMPWPLCVASPDERHTDTTGASAAIRMLGRLSRSDAAQWLACAAIYAVPARHAPAGLSLHDAALARCALVLGDIDGLREIWDGAAIFVDPHDDEALVHALQRLIADVPRRECYAELAFVRARRYGASAMAAAYAAAYAEIAPSACADVEPMLEGPAKMRC